AARIVLERTAENGNARASFMLAETFDPVNLSAWGISSMERAAKRTASWETPPNQRVHSRQGGWSLDEVADAEMSHVRDSFGTVVVPEFRSSFLAGIHPGDSSAAGVMGRPLGDVVDFS